MTESRAKIFYLTVKQKTLLKSIAAGLLIVQGFGFSGTEITLMPFWIALRDFTSHFAIIFVFWLIIPEVYRQKNWIWAGILGSLIFSIRFFVIAKFFYQLTMPELSILIMGTKIGFAGLGAVPQWLILRKKYKNAWLWVVGNMIAFSFTSLPSLLDLKNMSFITGIDNIILLEWTKAFFYALPFYIGNALLGLSLGLSIILFFEENKSAEEYTWKPNQTR